MKYFKKFIIYSAIAVPLGLPFFHSGFRELGSAGWQILIAIIVIRPLADILPDLKFLRKLVPLRKEFGILSASLILSHSYGYFLEYKLGVFEEISNPSFWTYTNYLMWGLLGSAVATILLITSNMFAVKLLKKWWKPIQRMSYLFLLLGGIHIMLIDPNKAFEVMIPLCIVAILWLLAKFKIKFRWKKQ